MALNVTSNCVYDYLKDDGCPFLKSRNEAINKDNTYKEYLEIIHRLSDEMGLDFELCRSTASIVGFQAVIDCIQGKGTIWYERNETTIEINRYKIQLSNQTGQFISPLIHVGLYDKNSLYLDKTLVSDVAYDLEPNASSAPYFLDISQHVILNSGFKTLTLKGFMGSRDEAPKLVISKSVDVIVCPGSIYRRT